MRNDVKIFFRVKRTINTGNYENITLEYGEEWVSDADHKDNDLLVLKEDVYSFLETEEQKIREQLREKEDERK